MTIEWGAVAIAAGIGMVASVTGERILGRGIDVALFRISGLFGHPGGTRKLSGIWRTRYTYESSKQVGRLEDEYLVVLKQGRVGIRGKSLKRPEGSNLRLDLRLDHSMVSGSWEEYTPEQQRRYHGTCQLALNAPGNLLSGKWLGFRSDDVIEDGPWEWTRLDTATGRRAKNRHREGPRLAWHRPLEDGAKASTTQA